MNKKNILDQFLKTKEKHNFNIEHIVGIMTDLIIAGVDTVR
jgi:hypothetical protein